MAVLSAAAVAAGCGGCGGSAPGPTPLATTLAWFHAINAKQPARVTRLLVDGVHNRQDPWTQPASEWPKFTGLRCRTIPHGGSYFGTGRPPPRTDLAAVHCDFDQLPATDGDRDSFWTVYLRLVSGRWRIQEWGQP